MYQLMLVCATFKQHKARNQNTPTMDFYAVCIKVHYFFPLKLTSRIVILIYTFKTLMIKMVGIFENKICCRLISGKCLRIIPMYWRPLFLKMINNFKLKMLMDYKCTSRGNIYFLVVFLISIYLIDFVFDGT